MGEHGIFIWASYGVCGLVLALLVMSTLRRIRDSENTLRSLETRRRPRGERRAEAETSGDGDEA